MHESEQLSLEQIGLFLEASEGLRFDGDDVHGWVQSVLCRHEYQRQGKAARGLLRLYLQKMSGLSRAQVTRLIARFVSVGRVSPADYRRRRFPRRFIPRDIELLAVVDEAHETLSGPATKRILEREFHIYGRQEFVRLATISVSHLYNLRHSERYRERHLHYEKTRPTRVAIGERRKPEPRGAPGFLRIDTVHQGDQRGDQPDSKGLYHINAVDQVTQWQIMASVPRISEAYLLPILEAMLHQFPFRIQNFHTDNGSEYINAPVSRLLNKLLIEQTKSRPRHSGDNGLVEAKNGAVIRKHMGYGYIASGHAELVNGFYREFLNPYVNYHRPSAQADVSIDAKGRKRVRYKRYQTPLETLLKLDKPARYLRQGVSIASLQRVQGAISDTDAARRMQQAKARLFEQLAEPHSQAAFGAAGAGRGIDGLMGRVENKEPFPTLPTDPGNRKSDSHNPSASTATLQAI